MKRFALFLFPFAALFAVSGAGCSDPASGSPDGDGGKDAIPDVRNEKDSSPPPSAECEPHDVTGFTPPAGKRTVKKVVCPDSWVDSVVDDCFGDEATQATCGKWLTTGDQAQKDCGACMITPQSSTTYGALITTTFDFVLPNVAGCAEVLEPGETACADKSQAQLACEMKACDKDWCPVPIQSANDLQEWNQCSQSANGGVCSTYANDFETCSAAITADTRAQCKLDGATDFAATAKAVGRIICGGAPMPDGGTDAGGNDDGG